jgi:hypothetical protein
MQRNGVAATSKPVTLHSIRGLMALIFQHCPLFYWEATALKSRTFVLKSRTTYTTKFVRDLSAEVEQWETAGEATWA